MFLLLLSKWVVLKEIAYVLSIPYHATIALQNKSLTLSDTFGIWLKMQLHLNACLNKKNYQTGLANNLLDAIIARKDHLFGTPLMAAALFIDPRFRSQIVHDETKVTQAKSVLQNIWRKLLTLFDTEQSPEEVINDNTSQNTEQNNEQISFEYDEQSELDKFLASNNTTEMVVSTAPSYEIDIELLLEIFDPAPLKSNENVLKWWETNKNEHNEMYKLATVVLAIPPTEVQIERDFSRLNFVFTDRRSKLTEQNLEDIMIISLNGEVFNLVKQDEQNEMMLSIDDIAYE